MSTSIAIEGTKFLINGRPTYEGFKYRGKPIEGLLFNSRMVQAIFDDENPDTVGNWCYPDTGRWDPERNTDEFCAALSEYRRHGLLAVTVGLQGGGAIYTPDVFDHFNNSSFTPEGLLNPAYFDRLKQVLEAADSQGMVVIVNYFYWAHMRRLEGETAIFRATERATEWLLNSGHNNILVDVMNEFREGPGLLESQRIHELIETVQGINQNGSRLLASSSLHPENLAPPGHWQMVQDFYLPHGNDFLPEDLRIQLQRIKASESFRENPRPLLMNEDMVGIESLEAAVDEYCSWGFYCQGYGSLMPFTRHKMDWMTKPRELRYEELSGFQTPPVNWGINTPTKRAFFEKVKQITTGE